MNISSVIPQIFYDLIARITPGLVIIFSASFISNGDKITGQDLLRCFEWFARRDVPTLLAIFAVLFASYMVAFALDGLRDLLPFRLFEEGSNSQIKDILSDYKKLDPKFDETNYEFPGIALRYDAVRLKDSASGARLAKLRAELHMCRILILGLSLLAILNLINLFKSDSSAAIISELVILALVVSFTRTHNRLNDRFTWGTCNHWLLLVKPGLPNSVKDQGLYRAVAAGDSI